MTVPAPSRRSGPVVIGAGVAGLVAARALGLAGRPAIVLERGPRPGGPVAAHRVELADGGAVELDAGADSFATTRPAVADLLAELGLADRIVPPSPRGAWVQHADGAAPLPAGALLGIPRDLSAPDLVAVIGPEAAARARELDAAPVTDLPVTIGALVRARLGDDVLRRLVGPVVGGVHAADPDELETDAVAPGLATAVHGTGSLTGAVARLRGDARPGSAVAGITGGMAALPAALAAAVLAGGGEIRCGTEVLHLTPGPGGTWRVRTAHEELLTPLVVLAAPAAGLLTGVVDPEVADVLDAPTTAVELVTLVLDAPALDAAPRGTGVLVAAGTRGVAAKALTHATAKWGWLAHRLPPGRHVLRLSTGRPGEQHSTDDPVARALHDAQLLLDVELPPAALVGSAVVRWPSALPRAVAGHRAAVARLDAALPPGVVVVGSAVAGNGLSAVVGDTRRRTARTR